MTAATAPGAPAAGHAREPRDERSSRTAMTKSISRSQVRLIASTNAIFSADEACAMLRISRDAMYRLAKDPDDPFPTPLHRRQDARRHRTARRARRTGRAEQRRRLARRG